MSADVVVLNDHPIGYRDELHEQLDALLAGGAWGAWKNRAGGTFLLRGDAMGEAERDLFFAAAHAVLRGDAGSIEEQLQQSRAEPVWPMPLRDRKSTRLNSSHSELSRMPSSA